MNRRQFLASLVGVVSVAVLEPKLSALVKVIEIHPPTPVLAPGGLTLADLMDGFAQIHENGLQVDYLFVNPKDWDGFRAMSGWNHSVEGGDSLKNPLIVKRDNWFQEETNPELTQGGVIGYVWDALVKLDPKVERGNPIMVSEENQPDSDRSLDVVTLETRAARIEDVVGHEELGKELPYRPLMLSSLSTSCWRLVAYGKDVAEGFKNNPKANVTKRIRIPRQIAWNGKL